MNERQIIQTLLDHGHQAYLVGGAVRDLLLGVEACDWDIATSATPEEILGIFQEAQFIGVSFPVCLVGEFEVATFRIDHHEGIGDRACQAQVCETIEEDLGRRDFTFNAIAMDVDGRLIDPFDGAADLESRVVKFVGNPCARIHEDPNRIIRAARMTAKIGGSIDVRSAEAIKENLHLLEHVAPERIRLEILKAMKVRKASVFWETLLETGVLHELIPELAENFGVDGGPYHAESVWDHLMEAGDQVHTKCPYVKLAAYFHDIGKARAQHVGPKGHVIFKGHDKIGAELTREVLNRFKFSSREIRKVAGLVELHMAAICDGGNKAARKLVAKLTETGNTYAEVFRIRVADNNANQNRANFTFSQVKDLFVRVEEAICDFDCALKITDLKINGRDVIEVLQIQPGPRVGQILQELFTQVEEDPSLNKRDVLIQRIQQL